MEDLIQVTIRTRATGHETVALPLEDLPVFIDRKLAEGRLVIAESGSESVVVRVGREILGFFRRWRATAAEQGRQPGKEEVTVLNPRAWRALVATEGEAAVAPLLHGGAIPVRSALWPNVVYLVRTDQIAVLREGQQVASICLQLADGGPVWDVVANRLQLLRAGPDGEVQVWATGNLR